MFPMVDLVVATVADMVAADAGFVGVVVSAAGLVVGKHTHV